MECPIASPHGHDAPASGLVMTKRAIRRRIVKNWQRRQRDEEIARRSTSGTCTTTDTVVSSQPTRPTGHRAVPSAVEDAATKGSSAHPLRTAASRPVVPSHHMDDANHMAFDMPAFRLGTCVPAVDQRPPFEFLFRMPSAPAESPPSPQRGIEDDEEDRAAAAKCAVVDDAFLAALITQGSEETSPGDRDYTADRQRTHHHGRSSGPQAPASQLPIPTATHTYTDSPTEAGTPGGLLTFRPVIRRVERQSPLPLAPFAAGTDLNMPPDNYLSLDSVWGLHRHAPGFYRDAEVATDALLSAASRIFTDGGRTVNVISTGEAMTRLFESSFRSDQPFTVHVHRVGPAIVLHAPEHGAPEPTVEQVRRKALLSKALYRMSNGPRQLTINARGSAPESDSSGALMALRAPSVAATGAAGPDSNTAVPPRAGSLAFSASVRHEDSLHNFGNVLHWGIQNLEVLIGLDTPVLLDRDHENTEVAFTLHDTLSGMELSDPNRVQYEALRCWFESTLANVAHVGFCVHNRGIVQAFELKKVADLLTLAEAQVATSAMGFTTNALRWLSEHCTEDGTDYAVIRNPETNTLELYALHTPAASSTRHVEGGHWDENHVDDDEDGASHLDAQQPPPTRGANEQSSHPSHTDKRTSPTHHTDVTLAFLCYRMGLHLSTKGKPAEALKLLLRSFQIYHLHSHDAASTAPMLDICCRLPSVVQEYLTLELCVPPEGSSGATAVGGVGSVPSLFQDALFACMRIEDRVRQMLEDCQYGTAVGECGGAKHRPRVAVRPHALAQMLVWCATALSSILGVCVDWWGVVRERLRRLKRLVVHRQRDSAVQIHVVVFKELVQVVLEGLVTLEGVCRALRPGVDDPTQPPPRQQSPLPATPTEESACHSTTVDCTVLACRGSTNNTARVWHLPAEDVATLTGALAEVMGDVCTCILADGSPMTATSVKEVSSLMLASLRTHRSVLCLTVLCNLSAPSMVTGSLHIYYEALRWYAKQSTRPLAQKLAYVHFVTGVQLHKTDRWTKAVEHLRRSLDVLQSSPNAAFSPFVTAGGHSSPCRLSEGHIRFELSVVLLKMAMCRRAKPTVMDGGEEHNAQRSAAALWILRHAPITRELLQPFSDDEEKQVVNCLSELHRCGSSPSSGACGDDGDGGACSTSLGLSAVETLYALRLAQRSASSDIVRTIAPKLAMLSSLQTAITVAADLLRSATERLLNSPVSVPLVMWQWVSKGWLTWMLTTVTLVMPAALDVCGTDGEVVGALAALVVGASPPKDFSLTQTKDSALELAWQCLQRAGLQVQTTSPAVHVETASGQRGLTNHPPEEEDGRLGGGGGIMMVVKPLVGASARHHLMLSVFLCNTLTGVRGRSLPVAACGLKDLILRSVCNWSAVEPSSMSLCKVAVMHCVAWCRTDDDVQLSTDEMKLTVDLLARLLRVGCTELVKKGGVCGALQCWKESLGALLSLEVGTEDDPNHSAVLKLRALARQCVSHVGLN